MLLENEDLEKSYDNDYFNVKVKEYGIKGVYDIHYNIPTNSFAYLPVAWLPPETAKIAWGILSLLFLVVSVILLLDVYEISIRDNIGILILILVLIWRPVYLDLALGQIYLFLLFLFSVTMKGIKRENTFITVIPISMSFLLKGYGWIILLWFLIRRKWRIALISGLCIILGFLITLYFIKWNTWVTYCSVLLNSIGRHSTDSLAAYQNINSFIRHLFIYDSGLNPYPLVNLPGTMVFVIVIVINLAIIFIMSKGLYKENNLKKLILSCSAFLGLGVITAPVAEEYSYVLFLPLAINLFKHLYEKFENDGKIILLEVIYGAAVLLIIMPLDYRALQFSPFPLWLLAYPKLYAGIILLICYYIVMRHLNYDSRVAKSQRS